MPAYSVPRPLQCAWDLCCHLGTQEVFDGWNASRGAYCLRHATALVTQLNAPATPEGLTLGANGCIVPRTQKG